MIVVWEDKALSSPAFVVPPLDAPFVDSGTGFPLMAKQKSDVDSASPSLH